MENISTNTSEANRFNNDLSFISMYGDLQDKVV